MSASEPLERPPRRPRMVRRLALVGVVALALAGVAYAVLRDAPHTTAAGRVAPDFSLRLLSGDGRLTSSDLKGRPVILNFWASWCGPCRDEAPLLERAWQTYRGRGLKIVGIDYEDSPQKARAFVRAHGLTYPMVADPDGAVARELRVAGLPQTFFLDRNWRFVAIGSGDEVGSHSGTVVLGAITDDVLQTQIDKLLGPPN